jgi:hypothetical protein
MGVISAVFTFAATQAVAAEGNAALERRWIGTYRSETIPDGVLRGTESFELLAHADGARTLTISTDLRARNGWFNVTLRVAGDYRPLEAYVNYWNAGRYKGSGYFLVVGDVLAAQSAGPSGRQSRETAVPARFSIGAHPVAADGWHTANHDASGASKQTIALYSVEAGADVTRAVLGEMVSLDIEYLGEEDLEVPAGRFATRKYRLAGVNDLWVYGADKIVVKSEIGVRNLRYVLTALLNCPADDTAPPTCPSVR